MAKDRKQIVRNLFTAYLNGDRKAVEDTFADGFQFTSPYDDRIDKAEYFKRCWPGNERIRTNEIETLSEDGNDVFVLYKCTVKDGTEFRNTERHSFAGDRIKSIEVYFGASYKGGKFVKQKAQ